MIRIAAAAAFLIASTQAEAKRQLQRLEQALAGQKPADAKAQLGARFVYANGTEVTHVTGNGVTFFGSSGKLYVNRGKFDLSVGETKKALGGLSLCRRAARQRRGELLPL